jgi:hypothetical protein
VDCHARGRAAASQYAACERNDVMMKSPTIGDLARSWRPRQEPGVNSHLQTLTSQRNIAPGVMAMSMGTVPATHQIGVRSFVHNFVKLG